MRTPFVSGKYEPRKSTKSRLPMKQTPIDSCLFRTASPARCTRARARTSDFSSERRGRYGQKKRRMRGRKKLRLKHNIYKLVFTFSSGSRGKQASRRLQITLVSDAFEELYEFVERKERGAGLLVGLPGALCHAQKIRLVFLLVPRAQQPRNSQWTQKGKGASGQGRIILQTCIMAKRHRQRSQPLVHSLRDTFILKLEQNVVDSLIRDISRRT